MAVPFYLPEGGQDENPSASTSTGVSSGSSGGTSPASSQSPNSTTSATQTPMQSPLIQSEQLVMAFYEAMHRYSRSQHFQYPAPPSPSCSIHSPAYPGGGVGERFFPRGRSTPRTPRTSVSFAAGEEIHFFQQHPPPTPQSAPALHYCQSNYCHNLSSNGMGACGGPVNHFSHYSYTPPPTPTSTVPSSTPGAMFHMNLTPSLGASTTAGPTTNRLHRSASDAARRSRLTSTGEDERENHSEHETSWDEFEDVSADRFENFTAGRERLQEFDGRIPPRKKKKEIPKPKEKKEAKFTWPAVITVLVIAMGCGFLAARSH